MLHEAGRLAATGPPDVALAVDHAHRPGLEAHEHIRRDRHHLTALDGPPSVASSGHRRPNVVDSRLHVGAR
jgi:hypothetical protein